MDDGNAPEGTKVVRLDTSFLEGLRVQADSLATRAATIVIDEERGVGFELSPESREAAVTLFMTLRAMTMLVDFVMEAQESLLAALIEGEEADSESCLVPIETFMKIIECSRMSAETQDVLENRHGISLVYH